MVLLSVLKTIIWYFSPNYLKIMIANKTTLYVSKSGGTPLSSVSQPFKGYRASDNKIVVKPLISRA